MEDLSLEKKILSTNDWGLVALLHEVLIDHFKGAVISIENEDYHGLNGLINKSRDILTELLVIFSKDDDLSTNLREIYIFINKLITSGEIKKDISSFQQSIDVINPVLEGFRELEKKEKGNIVSGLTYGKRELDEYSNRRGKSFEV